MTATVGGPLTTSSGSAIWADNDATITAASITNAGSIAAANNLSLAATTIDNGSGTLGAGNLLSLTFTNATLGNLAAPNDLAITVNNNWSLGAGQTFGAARNLTLIVHGDLDNLGTIQANNNASVSADGGLTNEANATIKAANLSLSSGGPLTNAGLINANGAATLAVGSLANTGQIFGNSVTVTSSGDVSNAGAAAVIATRSGALAILTPGNMSNTGGANLYALGNLVIAGRDGSSDGNWGQAASLLNSSATIQASGNGLLAANSITNTRTTLTADQVTTWQAGYNAIYPPNSIEIFSGPGYISSKNHTRIYWNDGTSDTQSASFAQTTKGTVGQGNVTIHDGAGSTDLASVNRDLGQTQVVTEDKTSGFTLYGDAGAAAEVGNIVQSVATGNTGANSKSVILSTASKFAQDPLAAPKAIATEVASLNDGKPDSGQLEKLVTGLKNAVDPQAFVQNRTQTYATLWSQAMAEKGVSADDQAASIAALPDITAKLAGLDQKLASGSWSVGLPDATKQQVAQAIQAYAVNGDTSPAAQAQFDSTVQQALAGDGSDDIVVVARRQALDGILSSVADITGDIGSAYKSVPGPVKVGIATLLTVAGGPKSVVTAIATQVSGVGDLINKGTTIATEAVDSVLQSQSLPTIQVQNKDTTTATNDQTTGIGLTGGVVLGAVGGSIVKGAGVLIGPQIEAVSAKIASGHAFAKHVLDQGEFAGLGIRTTAQLSGYIAQIIKSPSETGTLIGGRSYYYDATYDTVVIVNPKAVDGGTVFRIDPTRYPNPLDYLKTLK